MRCPTCDARTVPGASACIDGHQLADATGVIRLLAGGLRDQVAELEQAVAVWRSEQGRPPLSDSAVAALPFGRAVAGDHEWRLRRADLALIRRLLAARRSSSSGPLRVLDIGAWNGWLCRQLAADGHAATGLDLFAGPDALGTRARVPGRWRAVQADPMDPGRLDERFDVVVLDRCLAFQPDPVMAVGRACDLLDPGGMMIVTGIAVHPDPELARARLEAERAIFRERFGIDLLLRPSPGVMERPVLEELAAAGVRLRDHPFLRIANLRARLDAGRPRHRYGVIEVPP